MNALLERLTSDDFAVSVGFLLHAPALRKALQATEGVMQVRVALADDTLTEEVVRAFVSSLMDSLRKGERFPHELPLAALAVALEDRPTPFADEYLRGLAELRLAEMSVSVRVARECLSHRGASLPPQTPAGLVAAESPVHPTFGAG